MMTLKISLLPEYIKAKIYDPAKEKVIKVTNKMAQTYFTYADDKIDLAGMKAATLTDDGGSNDPVIEC